MKILVTGGAGYVGTVLCKQLVSAGHEVRCMDNFHKGSCDSIIPLVKKKSFEFINGDVTNLEDCRKALDGVEGVVHLAALVGFPACKKQQTLAREVNVKGTENIVRLSKDENTSLVFASTGSVYGAVEGVCTEESPTNTNTIYGLTKLEAEQAVSEHPKHLILRFATGFGVSPCMRVNLLVNDFVNKAVHEGCLVLFQSGFRRTFIHVYDMARSFCFGLDRLSKGQLSHKIYNVGCNSLNCTKQELANMIKEKTGCYVHNAEIGKDLDNRDYEVSYNKWEKEGFRVTYSLEEGIDELIEVSKVLSPENKYQ